MASIRASERVRKPGLFQICKMIHVVCSGSCALAQHSLFEFHKTTALACVALCLCRTVWKLLEDKGVVSMHTHIYICVGL